MQLNRKAKLSTVIGLTTRHALSLSQYFSVITNIFIMRNYFNKLRCNFLSDLMSRFKLFTIEQSNFIIPFTCILFREVKKMDTSFVATPLMKYNFFISFNEIKCYINSKK